MRRVLWGMLGVVGAVVAGLWALGLPPVERAVVGWAQARAGRAGIDLEVGSFDFDPWKVRVRVQALHVRGPSGRWRVDLDAGEVRLHPGRSLAGRPRLTLRLVRPRVRVAAGPGSGGGGPRQGPSEGARLWLASVEELEIVGGEVSWADPPRDLEVVLRSIEGRWKNDRGEVRLGRGEVRWAGRAQALEAVFRGSRRWGVLRIDEASLKLPWASVGLDGTWAGRDRLDLTLRIGLRAGEVPAEWIAAARLGRFAPLAGEVSVVGRVGGTVSEPAAKGTVRLSGGRFGPVTGATARASWKADGGGLRFTGLRVASSVGGVDAMEGGLYWDDGLRLEAAGRVEGFDLRPFMGLFVPRWFPVGLRATGRVEARGPLRPRLALRYRLSCGVEGLDVTVRPGEAPVYALARARVEAEGTVGTRDLTVDRADIRADSARVRISKGRVEYRKGLWFDTELSFEDLALAGRWAPAGLQARGTARGRFGGPYRNLEFTYDVGARVSYRNVDLGPVEARVWLDYRGLRIEQGRWTPPWGRVEVEGALGWAPDRPTELTVRAREADLAGLAGAVGGMGWPVPVEVGGTAGVRARLRGGPRDPRFEARIEGQGVTVGRLRIPDLTATVRARPGHWEVEELRAQVYGGTARGAGRGDRVGLEARVDLGGVDLDRLARAFGARLGPRLRVGAFRGRLDVAGLYSSPRVRAEGTVTGAVVAGRSLGPADVTAEWQKGRVRARARAYGGAVRVEAQVVPRPAGRLRVAWTLEGWDPGEWEGLLPRGLRLGRLDGSGTVEGRIGAPLPTWTAEGEVEAGAVAYLGRSAGSVKIRADAGGKGIGFRVWVPELGTRAEGLWSLEPGWPLELEVHASDLPLARVAGGGWDGRLSGNLRGVGGVRGVLQARSPAEVVSALAEVRGEVSWRNLRIPGGGAVPDGTARLETSEALPLVEVSAGPVAGTLRLLDRRRLAWRASARLRDARPELYLGPWIPPGWGGRVSGTAEAEGRAERLEAASIELRVEDLAGPGLRPSRWEVAARLAGGRWEATAKGGETLWAEGAWSPAEGGAGRVVLRGFDPAEWVAEGRWPKDVEVRVDGEVAFQVAARGALSAEADLSRVTVSVPPVRLRNHGPVRVRWDGGTLRFDQVWLENGEFTVTLSGRADLEEGWAVRGKVRCDLAALARFLPPVESARGVLFADLEVVGPWASPALRGPIKVLPGAEARLRALALPITEAEASAYLDPQEGLLLEWFDAALGSGRIHLEGRVPLDGIRPTDLRLWAEVRDVAHEQPPGVSYQVDADLLVSGLPPNLRIGGEIRLDRFRYTRRISWKTMLLDLLQRRPRRVEAAAAGGGVVVDLAVRGERDLRIENNLAQVDLAVDLRVRGALPRPLLWGRVEFTGGEVRFRNTVYEVRRSAVEFLGDAGPAPLLDVHARAQISGYLVNVDLTGPLDDYQVFLSSSPPLDRTDIVSLLTLGATSDTLAGGQGVSAAEAASFLTGKVQDTLESGVGEILGFDQFHIDPAYSPAAQSTVPRITIGKAITRDLYARYAATIGAETSQDLEVQYRLSPHVSVLGTWSDRGSETSGSLGGEVRFRFSFR
ncbi:translocation/assembly module TamB domain-containing protein [Deferrisoma camini]|uniref:translocation/assembly module TamB domain-containing protein n=1 Tax=Deferrisoma camini TaxID=1035120 RepID=UPI00146CB52E|nr:translocation/assembly module TamB domain-containing protein [Deferrisoma camini]